MWVGFQQLFFVPSATPIWPGALMCLQSISTVLGVIPCALYTGRENAKFNGIFYLVATVLCFSVL